MQLADLLYCLRPGGGWSVLICAYILYILTFVYLGTQAQRLSSVRMRPRRWALGPPDAVRHQLHHLAYVTYYCFVALDHVRFCLPLLSSTVCVHGPGGYCHLCLALAPGASGRALRMHDPRRQSSLLCAVGLRLRVSCSTIAK